MIGDLVIAGVVAAAFILWARAEDDANRADDRRAWGMRRFGQWWWRRDRDPLLWNQRDA